ncbi:uncharacterized protein LOC124440897 isoform X2 [Xenia sp. Carnegie-2017]|nr:uncharacterized protein LOC124440897 isoform X2 [Xenia sp. Carnegie-2017]
MSKPAIRKKEKTKSKAQYHDSTPYISHVPGWEDEGYNEIVVKMKSDKDKKPQTKQEYINGLKDTYAYNGNHKVNENGMEHFLSTEYRNAENKESMLVEIQPESVGFLESRKEISDLRTQIEKLSAFVENSEERREQAEALHVQQQEELLQHIREKEVLENQVCCIEERRRQLQKMVDEVYEENKSLKLALKSSDDKIIEEKEQVKVLKDEWTAEIAKNLQLELELKTIREELGGTGVLQHNRQKAVNDVSTVQDGQSQGFEPSPPIKVSEMKVDLFCIEIQEMEKFRNNFDSNVEQKQWMMCKTTQEEMHLPKTNYSGVIQHDDCHWIHEKKQFEGKMTLLEMDKTKMRSHIKILEEKLFTQENLLKNLRERNELLEFRNFELEYELVEKTMKQ